MIHPKGMTISVSFNKRRQCGAIRRYPQAHARCLASQEGHVSFPAARRISFPMSDRIQNVTNTPEKAHTGCEMIHTFFQKVLMS